MTGPATPSSGHVLGFLRRVRAVTTKELALLRHDRTVLAAIGAQPLVMLLVFGFAMSFEPRLVSWGVLDRSQTPASRQAIERVGTEDAFLPPRRVSGYAEGRDLLQRGVITALVVVPADYRRALEAGDPEVQVLLDGSDPLRAARVGGWISQLLSHPSVEVPPPPVDLRQEFRWNHTLSDRYFYLPALAGFLLTNLCLSAASLGLVAERENGTWEHLLAQPVRPIELLLGKLLPNVLLSYVGLIVCVLGAGLLYGFWPRGSLVALAVATLPFVLATLGIGVLVSALATNSAQSVFIAVFFIMPSFVLSGSMLPYQLMPHGVREFGGLFPLRWFQIIARRIILRGGGLDEVWGPMAVLLAIFGGLLLLIRWRMKPRLG